MMITMASRLWIMSLQSCVLILLVLLAGKLLKKYPKIYSYWLWILVGVRLLCPVLMEAPFSLQPDLPGYSDMLRGGDSLKAQGDREQERQFWSGEGDGQKQSALLAGIQPGRLCGAQQEQALPPGKTPDAQPDESLRVQQLSGLQLSGPAGIPDAGITETEVQLTRTNAEQSGVLGVLAIIYPAGTGIFLCVYLAQYLRMKRRIAFAVREQENIWLCENVKSPFVIGILSPKIILPYGLSGQEKYQVLRHERTHIRHRDPLIRLAGVLCICLHWWNPLVWLAVHKMNQDMEMFCDEAALRYAAAEERKAYAEALLSFAAKRSGFSLGLAFGESNTEKRVRNIMRKRKGSFIIILLVVLSAVFCACAFMTSPAEETGNGLQNINPNEDQDEDRYENQPEAQEENQKSEGDGEGESRSGNEETREESQSVTPTAAGGEEPESNPPAPEREAMLAAYTSVLESFYFEHTPPDDESYGFWEEADISDNSFALCDIDGDGKDELIVVWVTTFTAGNAVIVYGYDAVSDTVRRELYEYPALTFYENGVIEARASHNHGMAPGLEDFWPYTLYQYDTAADTYEIAGAVDAWDRTYAETKSNGTSFPEAVDADGDGIVYCVVSYGEEEFNASLDFEEYSRWRNSYLEGAEKIDVPYMRLTEENIYGIK